MNRRFTARIVFSWFILAVILDASLIQPALAAREPDRDTMQAELDEACEIARERKLAPLRAEFVEECVRERQLSSRRECETFYADYGAQSGNRAPLFYDLPECVEAFEYQNSNRRR